VIEIIRTRKDVADFSKRSVLKNPSKNSPITLIPYPKNKLVANINGIENFVYGSLIASFNIGINPCNRSYKNPNGPVSIIKKKIETIVISTNEVSFLSFLIIDIKSPKAEIINVMYPNQIMFTLL